MTPQEQPPQRLPNTALRFLTVCEGGNCRSTSLAMMLKATLQYDAIACSWKDISPDTFRMLASWADAIFVMESYMIAKIPEEYHSKMNLVDVGEDKWSNPFHPELVNLIQEKLARVEVKMRPLSTIRKNS